MQVAVYPSPGTASARQWPGYNAMRSHLGLRGFWCFFATLESALHTGNRKYHTGSALDGLP